MTYRRLFVLFEVMLMALMPLGIVLIGGHLAEDWKISYLLWLLLSFSVRGLVGFIYDIVGAVRNGPQ